MRWRVPALAGIPPYMVSCQAQPVDTQPLPPTATVSRPARSLNLTTWPATKHATDGLLRPASRRPHCSEDLGIVWLAHGERWKLRGMLGVAAEQKRWSEMAGCCHSSAQYAAHPPAAAGRPRTGWCSSTGSNAPRWRPPWVCAGCGAPSRPMQAQQQRRQPLPQPHRQRRPHPRRCLCSLSTG